MLITLALVVSSSKANAQESAAYIYGVTFGGGYYLMNAAKEINSDVIQGLPFNVKTINNFPPYFIYGGYVLVQISSGFAAGPTYQFLTTGSRIGLKDYSASYSFDQIVSAHSLGIMTELQLSKGAKPNLYFEFSGGVNFSKWELEEKLIIDTVKEEDITEFRAVKPFVTPAFKLKWPLSATYSIVAKAGYCIDLGGKYHLKNNKEATSDKKVVWNGFLASVAFEMGL